MTHAEEVIRQVIAPYPNVFYVRDCIPETSAFQSGRATDDVDADLYKAAYDALIHNVHDEHRSLDSVIVVDGTPRFQIQLCDELSLALGPFHTTPSVVGLTNAPVVFNRYLTFDLNERDLPVGVETIASVICPSITVPAVASRLCDTLYLTNMVIQGDVPADLDPDPSRHDREEEFPPLDDDYLQLDGDPNDIHYVFPPLDHAEDGDHGT